MLVQEKGATFKKRTPIGLKLAKKLGVRQVVKRIIIKKIRKRKEPKLDITAIFHTRREEPHRPEDVINGHYWGLLGGVFAAAEQ